MAQRNRDNGEFFLGIGCRATETHRPPRRWCSWWCPVSQAEGGSSTGCFCCLQIRILTLSNYNWFWSITYRCFFFFYRLHSLCLCVPGNSTSNPEKEEWACREFDHSWEVSQENAEELDYWIPHFVRWSGCKISETEGCGLSVVFYFCESLTWLYDDYPWHLKIPWGRGPSLPCFLQYLRHTGYSVNSSKRMMMEVWEREFRDENLNVSLMSL